MLLSTWILTLNSLNLKQNTTHKHANKHQGEGQCSLQVLLKTQREWKPPFLEQKYFLLSGNLFVYYNMVFIIS